MLRLGGQWRVAVRQDHLIYLGWDMTAALALGRAMGLPSRLLAELLPPIEAAAIRKLNETGSDG